MIRSILKIKNSNKAASMLEYALLVSLISLISIGAIQAIGLKVTDKLEIEVAGSIDGTYNASGAGTACGGIGQNACPLPP